MNGPFITTLYVIVGIIGFSALNHSLAFLNKRASRAHRLFSVMAVILIGHILFRIFAYHSQTASELVFLRRWETVYICFFAIAFIAFIAEYTSYRPRKFLIALTGFWVVLLAVNLLLPYGIQFIDAPQLTYLELPWGERVVDIRVLQRSIWHKLAWVGIIAFLSYALYASYIQYSTGNRKRGRGLAIAISVFTVLVTFNIFINVGNIPLPHTSDIGFLALVILMDIELSQEFRDQNRRMSDLLSYFPIAVGIKDMNGCYQLANPEFLRYFGVGANAINGKKDVDIFPTDLASLFQKAESEAIADSKSVVNEYTYVSEGKPRTMLLRKFPLKRVDGSIFGTCSVHTDITDQKNKDASLHKLRLQLWRSDRIASTTAITSSIAHEICQPLSAILNNAQAGLRFLTATPVDLEEIRELLQDIVRDDKRAGAVINGLRAMLQNQETPRSPIDINQCIIEVFEMLHIEFLRIGVKAESKLSVIKPVNANKVQIQQVLINLIMNALEAMAAHDVGEKSLFIHSEMVDAQTVLISIRDTGIGIPEDKLDEVFEGFYTTKSHGMGVGLEVCRTIIESHSGRIWVESNTDSGVTFKFVLPLNNK